MNQFTIICYYLPEPTYSLNSDLKLLLTLSKVYAIFTFIFLISWSDTVLILIIWISRVSSSCSYREGGRERRRGYDSSTKSPLLSSVFNWYHQVHLPTDDPRDLELQGCQGGETGWLIKDMIKQRSLSQTVTIILSYHPPPPFNLKFKCVITNTAKGFDHSLVVHTIFEMIGEIISVWIWLAWFVIDHFRFL